MTVWHEWAGDPGGPVVALIHGSMDRSAGLLRLSRRLADRAHVLRFDRRGYGRSVEHPGPFTMAGNVGDVVDLLAGHPAVVFGHSYGGDVALAVAATHPDLVTGVVVYEPPLSWLDWWPTTSAGSRAMAGEGDAGDAAERFMRGLLGDRVWERLPRGTRAARRAEGPAMLGELAELRQAEPWRPGDIRAPVVVLGGAEGAEHHQRGVRHLAALLPDARLRFVDGAKHFGPNTHAAEVAAEVASLLG